MKKHMIIWMALVWGTAVMAGEYWIQVAHLKQSSVPGPDFEKRLRQSGYSYTVKRDGKAVNVLVGSFTSRAAARQALKPIRCRVASDAFIVRGDEPTSREKVEVVPARLAVVQEGKKQPRPTGGDSGNGKQQREPCTCICDKYALRKAEINDAVEYYKHSSHHRFDPKAAEVLPDF